MSIASFEQVFMELRGVPYQWVFLMKETSIVML